MKPRGLDRILRAAHESAVAAEPSRPPGQTDRCLSLPRLAEGVQAGFSPAELAHVEECDFCQKVLRIEWSVECPSLTQLARHLAGQSAFSRSLAAHVDEDDCGRCRCLLGSKILQAAAAVLAATDEMPAMLDALRPQPAMLPALVGATGSTTRRPFQERFQDPATGLTVGLRERSDGELTVHLESDDPNRSGQSYRVEVLGTRRQLEIVLTLGRDEDGLCTAQGGLGSFAEVAPELGETCQLLVAPA